MKKFLFLISLLFLIFSLNGQTKGYGGGTQQSLVVVYDWVLSNQTCYGCGSFYYKVFRSSHKNHYGYYEYYVYFYSNSYYSDGVRGYTYIPLITVYCDGYKVGDSFWLIVYDTYLGYTLYSAYPDSKITLQWNKPVVY